MTIRRTSFRALVACSTGLVGALPLWLAAPADALASGCTLSGDVLSVPADEYAYNETWSVESGKLTIHDGSGIGVGQCNVVLATSVNTVNISAPSYADDWIVDLASNWTGKNGTDVRINLPAKQYDTVKLDGSSANTPVTVDWVGSGTTYQFDTDGDLTADISFDGQWGGFRGVKGGNSTDTIDLAGLPLQTYGTSILGNDGNDVITGWAGFDTITGGNGNDRLNGGGGSDTVNGDAGDDLTYGGDGSDVITDSDGADSLDGDSPGGEDGYADVLNVFWDGYQDQIGDATASYDKAVFYSDGLPVWASLDGVANDGAYSEDSLLGVHDVQTFASEDTIQADGFGGIDTGAGDDTVSLGQNFEGMLDWQAGDGTDTLDASAFYGSLHGSFYSGGSMLMTEGLAPGNIDGGGWENVKGGLLNDDLSAGCACTITPGPGNDTIDFGGAGTYVAGPAGDGTDTVTVDDGISGVKADYSARSAALSLTIDGEGNDGQSGEGDNLGFGITALTGGTGNDTLAGSTAADTLDGFAGDDRLLGRGGADRLVGDVGNDTLDGGSGNDVLLGQDGADTLYGRDGDDVLRSDDKYGAPGNDTLDGGNGDDDMFGYGGNDTFAEGSAANGSDLIAGGDGIDTASYSLRSSAVKLSINGKYDDGATGEADRIGSDIENLTGGKGADTLTGSSVANSLNGGAGNDTVTGGAGKDKLYGSDGNDTFQSLDSEVDALSGGAGTDRAHRDTADTVSSVEQRF